MTVCTNDVALVDLGEDGRSAVIAKTLGDVEALVAEMIELKHEWIRLTAVCAGSCAEELNEIFGSLVGDLPASA